MLCLNLIDLILHIYQQFNEINDIIIAFKNSILILVFEELVSTGLINEFKPNLNITNKQLLPKDTNSKKKKNKRGQKGTSRTGR